jgi:ribose transport system permease protein
VAEPEVAAPSADAARVSPGYGLGGLAHRARGSSLVPLIVLWIGVILYFASQSSSFLTGANLKSMLEENSVLFVVALAETVIVVMGSIDLSVGGVVVLSSLVLVLGNHGVPSGVAAALTVVAAAAMTAGFDGVPVGLLRMNPFVVTLGTASVFNGVADLVTNGNTEVLNHPALVNDLANHQLGPIPVAVVIMAVALVVFWLLLRYTYFGRDVYAAGGNQEAAALAGISVPIVRILGYLLLGLAAGVAALLSAGQLSSVAPNSQQTLPLSAIAAVLLGGTSLAGGKGSVVGTAVAVLFLGTVQNGLEVTNVNSFWQGVVTGVILVAAVGFDQFRQRFLASRQSKGQS